MDDPVSVLYRVVAREDVFGVANKQVKGVDFVETSKFTPLTGIFAPWRSHCHAFCGGDGDDINHGRTEAASLTFAIMVTF